MKTERDEPRSRLLDIIKNPLAFFTLTLLIIEGLMITAFFNLEQSYKIWAFLGSLLIIIFLALIVAKITLSNPENLSVGSNGMSHLQMDHKNQIEHSQINISLSTRWSRSDAMIIGHLTDVVSPLGELINNLAKQKKPIEVLNYALDFGYTGSWVMMDIFENHSIENVDYKALVIDTDSEYILDVLESHGDIHAGSVNNSIRRFNSYYHHYQNKIGLQHRNIRLELKAYQFPSVIHGFMVNNQYLYLGQTEMVNDKLNGGKFPYRYLEFDNSSPENKHNFNFYKSWFDYTWKRSRTLCKLE